jgi:hypothetical protein
VDAKRPCILWIIVYEVLLFTLFNVRQGIPIPDRFEGARQEWLGHADISTTRMYDKRQQHHEDSPTFKAWW